MPAIWRENDFGKESPGNYRQEKLSERNRMRPKLETHVFANVDCAEESKKNFSRCVRINADSPPLAPRKRAVNREMQKNIDISKRPAK